MKYKRTSISIGLALVMLLTLGTLLGSSSSRQALADVFGLAQVESASYPAVPVRTFQAQDAFHWLEPILPSSGDPANLDRTLLNHLTVEVCMVTGTGCSFVRSFSSAGVGSEQLRIITTGQGSHYIVNWDTQKAGISRTETYRLSVSIPGIQLGTILLTPNIYNTFGRTWPIKFLVENNPAIRVRIMRHLGKSASLIASALRNEFGLTEEEIAALLAGDPNPFTETEIEVALNGVFQENVVVAPNTKVSDENTSLVLNSYSPDSGRLVFGVETPFLKNVKTGDVLVGDPTAASPHGYLRKVTSKRKDKGQIILETTQATLADAVYQGTLDARNDLREADVDFTEALTPQGTMQRVEEPKSAKRDESFQKSDVGGGYEFNESFDEEFDFDSGEGDFSGTGKVRVQGSVSFNAGYNFGWGAELCITVVCVDRVEAHLGVRQHSEVRVTGDLKGNLHKEKVIKRKYFDPIAFMIGPIPVWILPIVDIVVGTDGNADVKFDFDGSVTSQVSAGVKWTDPGDNGKGWEPISSFATLEADANLNDFELNMKLTGYGKGKGRLLIYGVLGPTLDVAVGGGFEFHIPGNPVWKLYGHIRGDVTFEVSILGVIDLARFSDNVLLEEPEIERSENFAPRFFNVNTAPITARPNEAVYLGPRTLISPGAYEVMDPESEVPLTVIGRLEDGTRITDDQGNAVFTAPGTPKVTIIATDRHGATASIQLTVNVLNQQPVVEIYLSTDSIPATAQFFATIIATDPDLQYPSRVGCTTLDIQVTPAATWTRRGSSGNCVVWATFDQPGTYNLSVAAADANGGPGGNRSISINVTAAPPNPYPQIVEQTFSVLAEEGPFDSGSTNFLCIVGERCEAPSGVFLRAAEPDNVFYQLPLYFSLSATDSGGTAPTVNWVCQTGLSRLDIEWINGEPACRPIFSQSGPVKIFAEVTDSTGQTLLSEPRIYRMFQGGPN